MLWGSGVAQKNYLSFAMSVSTYSEHFLSIKREIAATYPDFQARATEAWAEIVKELAKVTERVSEKRSQV